MTSRQDDSCLVFRSLQQDAVITENRVVLTVYFTSIHSALMLQLWFLQTDVINEVRGMSEAHLAQRLWTKGIEPSFFWLGVHNYN